MGGDPKMRILIYADMRSPHAQGWVRGIKSAGFQVHAISSMGMSQSTHARRNKLSKQLQPASSTVRDRLRTLEATARLRRQRRHLRSAVDAFSPDIVHALRIPYEGVIALSAVGPQQPVVVSTWGQDLVRQVPNDPLLRSWVRHVLPRAAGAICDVQDDVARTHALGLARNAPTEIMAANFGLEAIQPTPKPIDLPTIAYIRGLRTHVDHAAFMHATEQLVLSGESARFVGIGLRGDSLSEQIAARHPGQIELTPPLPPDEFEDAIRQAAITVSPATSDGTPISVLQSLQLGCITVVGDLPQYREYSNDCPGISILQSISAEGIYEALSTHLQSLRMKGNSALPEPSLPTAHNAATSQRSIWTFYEEVVRGSQ